MSNEEGGTRGKVSGRAVVWREAASLRNGNSVHMMAEASTASLCRSLANYLCPGLDSH